MDGLSDAELWGSHSVPTHVWMYPPPTFSYATGNPSAHFHDSATVSPRAFASYVPFAVDKGSPT